MFAADLATSNPPVSNSAIEPFLCSHFVPDTHCILSGTSATIGDSMSSDKREDMAGLNTRSFDRKLAPLTNETQKLS